MQEHRGSDGNGSISFIQADGTALPLHDSVADTAVFCDVLGVGSTSSSSELLREAMRILKPSGAAVIQGAISQPYRPITYWGSP